jgi:hypothetical protein
MKTALSIDKIPKFHKQRQLLDHQLVDIQIATNGPLLHKSQYMKIKTRKFDDRQKFTTIHFQPGNSTQMTKILTV